MTPLLKGMIVSNEPGYYEDHAFGIRIEVLLTCLDFIRVCVCVCLEKWFLHISALKILIVYLYLCICTIVFLFSISLKA